MINVSAMKKPMIVLSTNLVYLLLLNVLLGTATTLLFSIKTEYKKASEQDKIAPIATSPTRAGINSGSNG